MRLFGNHCVWPVFLPLQSLPSHTAGTEPSLKFIALHHAPRSAGIHHCAFHGGEGREDVKSFAAERPVAAATGTDGHRWRYLLVPLSWKTNQTKCYDQRNPWEEHLIPQLVAHSYNTSTSEADAGGSGVQIQSWLQSKCEVSLGFRRPCLKWRSYRETGRIVEN